MEGHHDSWLLWQLLSVFTWKDENGMEVVVAFSFWAWFWEVIWTQLAKLNISIWHWKWIMHTLGRIFPLTPSCSPSFSLSSGLNSHWWRKYVSVKTHVPQKSKLSVFSDPFEICAVGKHTEGRACLTGQSSVTSQKTEEPKISFFLWQNSS